MGSKPAILDKAKAAAALVLAEGGSYRQAAKAAGVSHTAVFAWRRDDVTFANAVISQRRPMEDLCAAIVELSGGEIVKRLKDEAKIEAMEPEVLNRIMGTAADKLVAMERIRAPLKVELKAEVTAVTGEELAHRRAAFTARLLAEREEE